MRRPNKNAETPFRELLEGAGLSLPGVIDILNGKLAESKGNLAAVHGMLDNESKLRERVKILELELFIALISKL